MVKWLKNFFFSFFFSTTFFNIVFLYHGITSDSKFKFIYKIIIIQYMPQALHKATFILKLCILRMQDYFIFSAIKW